jgi:hypothetical protein
MANAIEIRQRLLEWLDGSISLRQFEDWFVPATWNAHRENNPEAESLADEIEINLSEYSGGQQNIEQLRGALRELANTVRPFVPPRVYAKPIEIVFGTPRFKTASASSVRDGQAAA